MDCFLCVFLFTVIGLTLFAWQLKLKSTKEPPCLPALPLIGSLLSLRSPHPPHVLFKELQKKYGQTYSLMMGSHRVIIVNQHMHAKEVLLKKGKTFAGRPRTVGICLNRSFCFFFVSTGVISVLLILFSIHVLCEKGNHRCSNQRWERHCIWRLQCYLEVTQENSAWSFVHVWRGFCLHREDQ